MCTAAPLRFEHIFQSADIRRYSAVELTRKRDAFLATGTLEQAQSYESALSKAIRQMHDRSHRTSLAHQPCFSWTVEGATHDSPCWYYEWSGITHAMTGLHLAVAQEAFADKDYQRAKNVLEGLEKHLLRRKSILKRWMWQTPQTPLWCRSAFVGGQLHLVRAYRALAILHYCAGLEQATPDQLYSAACNAEKHAVHAAGLCPLVPALDLIEQSRVHRAWWRAQCLWEEGAHGAAIGLATAWSQLEVPASAWFLKPDWASALHDWHHDNNNVYYEKITTPTTI